MGRQHGLQVERPEHLIPNEKRMLISGWLLRLEGKEWFRAADINPIMARLYQEQSPERSIKSPGAGTLVSIAKNLGTAGLLETQWRGVKNKPRQQPMRFHRLTEEGLVIAPSFYLQHRLPLIKTPDQLKDWLADPLSRTVIEGVEYNGILPDLSEETFSIEVAEAHT